MFVGYQRRYAAAFLDAIEEVGGMGKVQYARVRDIIGPNATFVGQSGTFPIKFNDFRKEDTQEMLEKDEEVTMQGLNEYGVKVTSEAMDMARLLARYFSPPLRFPCEPASMPDLTLIFVVV